MMGAAERRLASNLAALGNVDSDLSGRLRLVRIEEHFEPAMGRDGWATLRRKTRDGKRTWIGRTSMPTISAPALLENFEDGGGNVVFFGAGQGMEVSLLLDGVKRHQTLFILEPDAVELAGVLCLFDYRAVLGRRSLVLVVATDPLEELLRFLKEHAGFDPPLRFLQWPWQDPIEIMRLKSGLEDMHATIGRHREGEVGRMALALRSRSGGKKSDPRSSCVVISRRDDVDARMAFGGLVALDGEAGGSKEDGPWRICGVDWHRPGHTSAVGLLEVIDRGNPQFVLLLNEVREQLGPLLSVDVPVVSWFLGPRHAAAVGSAGPGAGDKLFADSPATARRLARGGIPEDRIRILCAGADQSVLAATDQLVLGCADTAVAPGCDVAVLAYAADLSPSAWGIELGTLASIWRATVEALVRQAEEVSADQLPRILEQVVRRGRVTLSDAHLRDDLVDRLEFDVSQTILTSYYVRALVRGGIRVRLWGRGWEAVEDLRDMWAGPLPEGAGLGEVLAGSKIVLDCCIHERFSGLAFDAALAGAVPILRGWFKGEGPGGKGPAWQRDGMQGKPDFPAFQSAGDLLKTVRKLLDEPDRYADMAETVGRQVRSGHLMSHRLETLASSVG